MLSFLYVYSDHSILECYNLFSGVELSMRSFFVISYLNQAPLSLSLPHIFPPSSSSRGADSDMMGATLCRDFDLQKSCIHLHQSSNNARSILLGAMLNSTIMHTTPTVCLATSNTNGTPLLVVMVECKCGGS